MRTMLAAVAAGLALFAVAIPASAHHAFALEYDANKFLELEGVVQKIEWTNPHARVYVDVTDSDGTVNTWNLELASLSALVRNGWTRTSLKPGDAVTVEGFEGRGTNTHRMSAIAIRTPDGLELFSGAAGEDGRPVPPRR